MAPGEPQAGRATPPGDDASATTAGDQPLGELRRDLASALQAAGVESPDRDAKLLLRHALGLDATDVLLRPWQPVSPAGQAAVAALAARRAAREPVSRILGRREFWSLDFALGPDSLDPRPDSETLIEAALETLGGQPPAPAILDLGTGSGCLLLAALSEWPAAEGVGLDLSAGALEVAAANARRLGLAGRARFVRGDWHLSLATLLDGQRFDLVLCNPPYIPAADLESLQPEVRLYDPPRALDGGADGLAAYRVIAPQLPGLLTAAGVAIFEVGSGQARAVATVFEEAGLTVRSIRGDLAGIERCIVAQVNRQNAAALEKAVGNPPGPD